MKKKSKMYVRMSLYIGITAIITFLTLIDSFTNEQIETFTDLDWLRLTFKSFIPSLVSLKAYLDSTVQETNQITQIIQPELDQKNSIETTATTTPKRKRQPRAD